MKTDAEIRDRDSERNARVAAASQPSEGKTSPPVTVVVEGAKQSGVKINRDADGKITGASPGGG